MTSPADAADPAERGTAPAEGLASPAEQPALVPGRAAIVGTGLIGASVGLALRQRGWQVSGQDRDDRRADAALRLGALDRIGLDSDAEITFVATPASAVVSQARRALEDGGLVTDVAGVKGSIAEALSHPRFVGGHPMAGSEQDGVEGADPELFAGATWVLTPTVETDPTAYARVRAVVTSLGAEVVALPPQRHDALVALVSHVPHLTAATLMGLAADRADEHAALLRLAAGGFRDMTRVAAGHPGIWPDICIENREAIVAAIDRLLAAMSETRDRVAAEDRDGLLALLERARKARMNLPVRAVQPEDLTELRVPVPDRPGVLAEVATLFGELGVNIVTFEVAHSTEGPSGVFLLVVETASAELARGALLARGFRPTATPLA